jgi:hypothetical protein
VSTVDVRGLAWRKSSRSGGGNNDACVEIAIAGHTIAIRDSKNPVAILTFPMPSFAALTSRELAAPCRGEATRVCGSS